MRYIFDKSSMQEKDRILLLVGGRPLEHKEGSIVLLRAHFADKTITKTCLFKYTENFITKKMKICR